MHGFTCVFVRGRMFPCTAGANAAKWFENSTHCTRTWSRCRTAKAPNPSMGHEETNPKQREPLQVHTARYEYISDIDGLLCLLGNRRPSPYIVSFYDAFVDRAKNCMCLVMEYMSTGSLQDIVLRGGCQNEKILARLATGVLRGLAHIHRKHMVHRDIKPHNLLTNRQGEVKISDFGLARTLNDNSSTAKTFVGTLLYMAPERIGGGDYSYPGMRAHPAVSR
jgi:serine/threonine protein kinase